MGEATVTSLRLLAPELVLCALALIVLVVDLFLNDEHKVVLAWLSGIGLLAAFLAAAQSFVLGVPAASAAAPLPRWAVATYTVDAFSIFFKLLIIGCVFLVVLSSVDYLKKQATEWEGEFYALLLFAALGMCLMAGATNLLSIYLAMEFTSITSYILAGYHKRQARSAEAGMKYFLIGVVSSAIMLYGMSLLYGLTGEASVVALAKTLGRPLEQDSALVMLAFVMLFVGFSFKIAAVPFHAWAPDTYEGAPTPFTAYLSVGSKAAGFAVLLRVFDVALAPARADWTPVIAAVAALTMVLGNLAAIPQTNLKRLLAYSSIGQAGYLLIGVAASGPSDWRIPGILLYLTCYLFMNLGAFAVVILVSNALGKENVEDYAGLVARSPFGAVAFVIFVASLAGIPPTAGFWGKAFLFGTAISSRMTWLAVVGIACTVISVYYYFGVVKWMFMERGNAQQRLAPVRTSWPLNVALALAMIGTLGIGVYPQPLIELARQSLLTQ